MRQTLPNTRWAVAFAAVLLLGAPNFAASEEQSASDLPLHLRAFAVNMTGAGATRAGTIDITIERWSTDAERQKLVDTLIEKSPDKLLDALQAIEPRAGFVRTSTSLGWDIYYAREEALPSGGRRIVFATDRPMSMWELQNSPRSRDYEFMLCEIRIGPDGRGQGKLAGMAKVTWNRDTHTIEIENYGIEPVRLQDVQVVK
jgi:hypothetical protein